MEKFLGIEIIKSPNIPEGHLIVKNGNELLLIYPRTSKSFTMLNHLAPLHFNKSDVWKYESKSLGEYNLTPNYDITIPKREIKPTEYNKSFFRLGGL